MGFRGRAPGDADPLRSGRGADRDRESHQDVRHDRRARPHRSGDPRARVPRPARPFGLRQDHAAAHPGGARRAGLRHGPVRRPGRAEPAARAAAGRLRVPALRPVQPHDRIRQRGVRPRGAAARQAAGIERDRPARRGTARAGAACRFRGTVSGAAFRRPAPARRACARARDRAEGAVAGRAVRRARRQGAGGTAALAARDP